MTLELRFDSAGLLPCIVQDALTGRVLMFAWMNAESLRLTRESGEVVFWSRSRGELWRKGATSGNVLRVREMRADCDGDVLLVDRAVTPRSGHVVVAVVDGEFVCKTLSIRAGRVKLRAANPGYPDIVPVDSQTVEVWGVVTASIKQFAT